MSGTFSVMTFNVRGSQHRDGENVWRRRMPLNVSVIERHSPDVIGFQEHQKGNARTYEKKLADYERISGPCYENRRPHAHNAIYWKPRRLEMLASGGFWLSETPEEFSRSWESSHVRAANWARFRLLPGGPEFVHLNTHLDHKSGEARQEGARLIAHQLEEMGNELPVVLTGDFNCDPGSKTYEILADAGFTDAHLAANNPPANTFHRFRGEDFEPRNPEREMRIDWVLLRDGTKAGWNVYSCDVVRDAEPPLYPSDHYPVLAWLSLAD